MSAYPMFAWLPAEYVNPHLLRFVNNQRVKEFSVTSVYGFKQHAGNNDFCADCHDWLLWGLEFCKRTQKSTLYSINQYYWKKDINILIIRDWLFCKNEITKSWTCFSNLRGMCLQTTIFQMREAELETPGKLFWKMPEKARMEILENSKSYRALKYWVPSEPSVFLCFKLLREMFRL